MPKGKIITVDEVLGPLFRYLDKKSPDARSIVAGMVQKEVNRLNARPVARVKAKPRQVAAVAASGALKASNFDAAKGALAPKPPKPAKKKSHKKKPQLQEAAEPRAAGENSDI